MKKLLLGVAAFGLLSSVALAEPLKLEDGALGDVVGGVDFDGSTSTTSFMVSQWTNTARTTSTETRSNTADLMSGATNTNNATGMWSSGVSASGSANSMITNTIN